MKKTILGLFAFVCAFSGSSCSEDDLSGTSVIKPEQTTETPLDAWLYKNYIAQITYRQRYLSNSTIRSKNNLQTFYTNLIGGISPPIFL